MTATRRSPGNDVGNGVGDVLGLHRLDPLHLMRGRTPRSAPGVAVTLIAGLTESFKLRRRRRRQADLEAIRAAQVWRPYDKR